MKRNVILLVEDNSVDAESIKGTLKKMEISHTLHAANNGADALAMLTGTQTGYASFIPDVILLDISMPKMNGIEFLGIIKNYYNLKNIKIFILTTSSEEYNKLPTEHFDIAGYIIKPLTFNDQASKDALKLLVELIS